MTAAGGVGHNSGDSEKRGLDAAAGVAGDQLRSFIERIERLEEEKRALADDIKDIYAEAKGVGFDPKILRKVIALRKRDKAEIAEEQALIDIYLDALQFGLETGL